MEYTVKELIAKLQEFNEDAIVCTSFQNCFEK